GSGRATESGDGPGAERADSSRLAAGDARLLGCAHGGAIPRHRRGRARAGGVRAAASSVLRARTAAATPPGAATIPTGDLPVLQRGVRASLADLGGSQRWATCVARRVVH